VEGGLIGGRDARERWPFEGIDIGKPGGVIV